MSAGGFVYIVGSDTGTMYIGVTSNLVRRVLEHKSGGGSAFTTKYRCHRLLYYEVFHDIVGAISREKQLKGKTRAKKTALIQSFNPEFRDLAKTLGWLTIGPYRSIEEAEAEFKSRYSRTETGESERVPERSGEPCLAEIFRSAQDDD